MSLLPVTLTKAQQKSIARYRRKVARFMAPKPIQHIDGKPLNEEEKQFASAAKKQMANMLGRPESDVHVVVVPDLGEMLRDGARDFLADIDPAFLDRLDKHRFGS